MCHPHSKIFRFMYALKVVIPCRDRPCPVQVTPPQVPSLPKLPAPPSPPALPKPALPTPPSVPSTPPPFQAEKPKVASAKPLHLGSPLMIALPYAGMQPRALRQIYTRG